MTECQRERRRAESSCSIKWSAFHSIIRHRRSELEVRLVDVAGLDCKIEHITGKKVKEN